MLINNLQDFESQINGKRVLIRVDFNVPIDEKGHVTGDERIRQAIPTIKYVLDNGGKPILMSHLGRPDGKVVETLRMVHVGERLEDILRDSGQYGVVKVGSWDFKSIKRAIDESKPTDVVLLENLRFRKEEEKKQEKNSKKREGFAEKLSGLADFYVNDAFGTAHRDDTSVYYVPFYLPSAAGLLVQRELKELQALVENPGKHFTLILGGAKITDKIGVIDALYGSASKILIGGKMCLAFLKAKGYSIGAAEIDDRDYEEARKLLGKYGERKIMLPVDMVVADDDSKDADYKTVPVQKIPPTWFPFDIGKETILTWGPFIKRSSSFFWNGPLGKDKYSYARKGTSQTAELIRLSDLGGVIGGGDTVEALFGVKFSQKVFLSTGGGATLEYLAGLSMPALEALEKSYEKFR